LPIAAYSPGIFVGSSRRGDVLVDAGHVVERVVLEPAPALAVEVVAEVELALEVGLRVRGQRPLLGIHRAVGGGAADERRQLGAAQVAEHVDEEEAVLRGGVACAEHRAGARRAVDVGDAEGLVAHDGDVAARADARRHVRGLHPEGRVLVEAPEVLGLQARRRVHQIAVHRHLVVVVRGPCARREERRQLDAVGEAVRAGREQVAEPAGVVGAVGLDVGLRRRNNRDEDDRPDGGDETPHVTSCRPRGSLAAQCHAMRHLPARQVRRSVRRCC
jgi:hypothetical protein